MSIIRHNLLTVPFYVPYCGQPIDYPCSMPRTTLKDGQFECMECGWRSAFEPEFIAKVRAFREQARKGA